MIRQNSGKVYKITKIIVESVDNSRLVCYTKDSDEEIVTSN
nr:MAG TPA: hypothetical protein [Caudoviricetes sp.]